MGSLRALAIPQQIGLLFVLVFGVLALATLGMFMRSLKPMTDEQREGLHAFRLDLRAMWIGTLLFWMSWAAGPVVSTVLFALVSFLAMREFITQFRATPPARQRLRSPVRRWSQVASRSPASSSTAWRLDAMSKCSASNVAFGGRAGPRSSVRSNGAIS